MAAKTLRRCCNRGGPRRGTCLRPFVPPRLGKAVAVVERRAFLWWAFA